MSRIYLDACCIIYLVEAESPFHAVVVRRLLQHQTDPASRLLTSRLSCLECRTRPVRDNDRRLLAAYDKLFGANRMSIVEITAEVVASATSLRAGYGFKTPDAIHLASAIEEKADVFLTGDSSLARCTEIPVEILESGMR
jgi:predicted nucleic acid-binding protein